MITSKHPISECPCAYIGDGVYAEWDGYQVWLRVNDKLAPRVVALEPTIMEILKRFSDNMIRSSGIEVAKKLAFDALSRHEALAKVKGIFVTEMLCIDKLNDEDRIELATWNFNILDTAPPAEDQLVAWINSFN